MQQTRERQEKFGKIIYNPRIDRFTLEAETPESYSDFCKSELSAPLTVHWLVTLKCNARCKYCYERDFLLSPGAEEDILSREEISSFLRDFSTAGGFRIYLTGGEPTLNPNLPFIIRAAYDYGLKSVVNSNGLYFPDEAYKSVKECGARLSLSLDSHIREIHNESRNQDSYDSLVKLIDSAAKDFVDLRVISVFQNASPDYWHEFGNFLQEKGVRSWFIQPLVGMEVPVDLEDRLNSELPRMCTRVLPAIFDSFFYILPNGDVASYAFQKKNIYGNVGTDSLQAIWEKVPNKTILDYRGLLHMKFRRTRK